MDMILVIADRTGTEYVKRLLRQKHETSIVCLMWDNLHGPDLVLKEDLDSYETIIIAYQDIRCSDLVCEWLVHQIPENKDNVLNFYRIYNLRLPATNWERVMTRDPETEYQGMILGISHACMGIRQEMFDEPFCNLALHSQDLYYNLLTLKRCIEQFPDQISKLKYLIIDLLDYNYFNYDTSQSSYATALNYYSTGGICDDLHHIEKNKNMKYTPQQLFHSFEVDKWGNTTMHQVTRWEQLFLDDRLPADCEHFFGDISSYRVGDIFKTVTPSDVQAFQNSLGTMDKTHEETVRENVECLREIMRLAYEVNPEMEIWAILMPRYAKAREVVRDATERWKTLFLDCLNQVGESYDFNFLDCSEDEISNRAELYYDAVHFNYLGAAEYTAFLNNVIHGRLKQ